jgi:hypothetical protein
MEILKKQKYGGSSNIPQSLRKRVWELHVGIGVKETTCPLCGTNRINASQNSGFQACHIVADKYLYKRELNALYLYPGCQVCNNECADLCILDFLYVRERYKELRSLIWNVFTAFTTQHEDELAYHEGLCWRVIQHLYGRVKFPAGGGIVNEKQIYEIARTEQYSHLLKELQGVNARLQELAKQMNAVISSDIKPLKLLI